MKDSFAVCQKLSLDHKVTAGNYIEARDNAFFEGEMGNIIFLLRLGKKLFLRKKTSMWANYLNQGFKIYDASVLGNLSLEELTFFDNIDQTNNILLGDTLSFPEKARERWDAVLKSEIGVLD